MNFLLNLWLISRYQAQGAAIASVIAEVFVASLMFYDCRHYLNTGKIVKMFSLYLLCAAVMAGILMVIINRITLGAFWKLSILSITGAVIYGAVLLIIKDDLIFSAIKTVFRKITDKFPEKH